MSRIYTQKYGKFVETRFHEAEHEPKMRLLKTHSHTSEVQPTRLVARSRGGGYTTKPVLKHDVQTGTVFQRYSNGAMACHGEHLQLRHFCLY